MLKPVNRSNVTMLPGIFKERMDTNRAYLLELDSMCLLQNFYLEAGIVMPGLQILSEPENARLHWGWEAPTCQLRGHFLGHWLSAAAALIASDHDMALKVKLDAIVAELAKCQELNGGRWIGPFPEKYFEKLARNEYIWSPQYVMHKLIMGLTHAYRDAGNKQALSVLDHLADWYLDWTSDMQKRNPHAIYSGEEGGMLESLALLFELTGDEKYQTLYRRYQKPSMFQKLSAGQDTLSNCHANASIPLSHGSAKLYEITKDEAYKKITEAFWKSAVTDRGSFCTGSQNAGEFWIPPFLSGHYLSERDQEFCTVYNMVRTASYLYQWTGDSAYGDYIEKSLYNGFLAQQNPKTGTPTYFLPLIAGGKKKWGSKTRDFWCCHGTMVQAQTLYPELIYFKDTFKEHIVINQYIPSVLTDAVNNSSIKLTQTTAMKYYNDEAYFDEADGSQTSRWSLQFDISCEALNHFTLSFRIPSWVQDTPDVEVNGTSIEKLDIQNGYLNLNADWKEDTIKIYFKSQIIMEALPDMPECAAAVDGPIVLAGLTKKDCGLSGNFNEPEKIFIPQLEHTYDSYPWKQNSYQTRNQAENIHFKPLYEIDEEAYTVYFTQK